jgi:hypothetical protein
MHPGDRGYLHSEVGRVFSHQRGGAGPGDRRAFHDILENWRIGTGRGECKVHQPEWRKGINSSPHG